MFFAGISGSSTADVAVLSRTVAPEMDREGYDRAFTAALIACASTMANLIPPSIMAVVYGATGNVSIGGLFLGGIVPGVLIGIGLDDLFSYFFGPVGVKKRMATLRRIRATRSRARPCRLMIPLIIMGGILTGWFTPTEAGMIAVGLHPGRADTVAEPRPPPLPAVGLRLHRACSTAIPLAAVAGASAFGWMLGYLRGPDIVAGWISNFAGTDAGMIMLLLVHLVRDHRRLRRRRCRRSSSSCRSSTS